MSRKGWYDSSWFHFLTGVCGLFRSTVENFNGCFDWSIDLRRTGMWNVNRVYLCVCLLIYVVWHVTWEKKSYLIWSSRGRKKTNGAENTLLTAFRAAWNSSASQSQYLLRIERSKTFARTTQARTHTHVTDTVKKNPCPTAKAWANY